MKISVIMGIYNCEEYLAQAVECILDQTYKDWELIMCDDGSSDKTYEVADQYRKNYPDKIILLRNSNNRGLNYTVYKCLKYANGEYIARMDGDDLCAPDRFEKEVAILDTKKDISIVSSHLEYFDESGVWGICKYSEYPKKESMVKGSEFCHAACMVRKEAFDRVGGYTVDKRLLRVEDYHLWMKMYAAGYKGYNIQEPLYQMRDDKNAFSRRKFRYRINEAYVRSLIIRKFKLPVYTYIWVIIPLIIGLIPPHIYNYLHKKRLNGKKR